MAVPGKTLVEFFLNRVAKTPDLPAMHHKQDGSWKTITWQSFGDQAKEIANGLISLGIEKDDCVALLSLNRPEWLLCDVGIMLAGAKTIPIYVTSSPNQVSYIMSHSESKVAIVENQDQLDKILKTKTEMPQLQKVVVITGESAGEEDWIISLDELKRLGREYARENNTLDERVAATKPEDLATIVYTSGTTGPPKGVMLTHANFVWTAESIGKVLPFNDGGDRVLSYLPLSHIFERLTSAWGGVHNGTDVWFAQSTQTLREDLADCRPTFFIGVPRVYEKFHMGMLANIEKHPKKDLVKKAIAAGMEKLELEQAGKSVPLGLKLKHALLDRLVLSKLRHGIGMENVRFAVTGAAAINPEILKFLHAIGIDVLEGYGQTEDNAPTSVNPPGRARIGTVGPPIPGLEVKIAEDGEILVRGPNVFKGYYKNDKATKETLTEDGWLHTGDVGEFDEAGYLKVTDRKKDLFKTAGGKYIAPADIEGKLKFAPIIGQAVVIGDNRPFPTALLTLDPDVSPAWAKEKGIEFTDLTDLSANEKVLEEVQKVVDEVNESLSQPERVKKWTLLERDFSEDAEEITPTLKVRRKTITEKYSDVIDRMYVD